MCKGADKSLAQTDWKKQLQCRHFLSEAGVIAPTETLLDGQISDFFLSDLQNLEFVRSSLFRSYRAKDVSHPGNKDLFFTFNSIYCLAVL
jgi:hypothetical protein